MRFLLFWLALAFPFLWAHESPLQKLRVDRATVKLDANVALTASPDFLQKADGFVKVSISGIQDPKADDWIAMHYNWQPGNKRTPAKYVLASSDSKYLKTGAASFNLQVFNSRYDTVFVFYRNGTNFPVETAVSNPVKFESYNYPTGVRTALTENAGELRISWTMKDDDLTGCVWYGEESGKYTKVVTTTQRNTYTLAQMCHAPASTVGWNEPGVFYTAILKDLEPAKRYYYRVGQCVNEAPMTQSDEFSFKGPYSAGQTNADGVTTFVIFGDMGQAEIDGSNEQAQQPASRNTTGAIFDEIMNPKPYSRAPEFLLHIGDISYARGYQSQWEVFHNQIEPIAARIPYMASIGNHERDSPNSGSFLNGTDSGGECGIAFQSRFIMPPPADVPENDQPWFYFSYGLVTFIQLSSEHDFSPNSPQYIWFEKTLEHVSSPSYRALAPWIFVTAHRPMYLDSWYQPDQDVAALMRKYLEPLLLKYKVNAFFQGHHHSYQRSCRLANNKCVKDSDIGVLHVVTGAAGFASSTTLQPVAPSWARVVFNDKHGYSHLEVTRTNATFTFLSGIGEGKGMYDQYTLPYIV